MGWVVQTLLESAVKVGEGLGGGAEAHGFAEVVSALLAVPTRVAHDAALYSDALADTEVGDAGADGGDDTCGLMAEDEGRLDAEVAVAAMGKVVEVGAAETSRAYGDLGFADGRRPESAALSTEVACTVTDDSGGRGESKSRHVERIWRVDVWTCGRLDVWTLDVVGLVFFGWKNKKSGMSTVVLWFCQSMRQIGQTVRR